MNSKKGIGSELSRLRKERGLTQSRLAYMIGVTPAAVGNYEQDISFPRAETLYRLFEALSCTPNQLFGFDDIEQIAVAARKGSGKAPLGAPLGNILDEPDYDGR